MAVEICPVVSESVAANPKISPPCAAAPVPLFWLPEPLLDDEDDPPCPPPEDPPFPGAWVGCGVLDGVPDGVGCGVALALLLVFVLPVFCTFT